MPHSIFTIVGPVMVGPSSSHTAGAVRLGNVARALFGELPKEVEIILYGSFGEVYMGHGTDSALVAGVLGLSPSDPMIKASFGLAKKDGMKVKMVPKPHDGKEYHPNTAEFRFHAGTRNMRVLGASVGGGIINIFQIGDLPVALNGEHDMVIFTAKNQLKARALVEKALKKSGEEILQFFSRPKNDESTRYVVELSKAPKALAEALDDEDRVTRFSVVPHISLWDNVCMVSVPDMLSTVEKHKKKKSS